VLKAAKLIRPDRLPRSFHAFGTNVILLPLGILGSILIARSIGPGEKGNLDLILATAALLGMVLSFSLPTGVTYIVAREKVNIRALAIRLILISLVFASVAGGVLAILRYLGRSSSFLPERMGGWIIVGVAVFVFLEMLANFLRAILNGKQEIIKVNHCELVGRFSQVVMLFILAAVLYVLGRRLFVWALFLLSMGVTVLINILLIRVLSRYWKESTGEGSSINGVVRFALPSYLGNLAQFLNYKLDVFIVSLFAGFASVGRYTLAVSLAQLLWMLSNGAATVLLPKVAANNTAENVSHTARVTRLSLSASLLAAIALGVVAGYALPRLYGEPFRPSVAALLWLLPGIVAFSSVNVLAAYINGIGKPRLNLIVAVASLGVTLTLDFILIPSLGIVGAALASTCSYTLSAVLTIWLFIRETRSSVREVVIPNSSDFKLLTSLVRSLMSRAPLQQVSG